MQVRDLHYEEFLGRVSVFPHCRLINCQEVLRVQIKNKSGMWIALKQQLIALLAECKFSCLRREAPVNERSQEPPAENYKSY